MNSNTNGFNYYSEYQGHKGPYVIILLIIFLCLMFAKSFKRDEPIDDINSSNNNYDETYYNDLDNNSDSVNDNDSNISNNSDSSIDDQDNHNLFEYYQG